MSAFEPVSAEQALFRSDDFPDWRMRAATAADNAQLLNLSLIHI